MRLLHPMIYVKTHKITTKALQKYSYGFGVLDSLFAIVLLGFILININKYYNSVILEQSAKKLSQQTKYFANIVTDYINKEDVYNDILLASKNNLVILNNKNTVFLANLTNLYNQHLCVLIKYNAILNNLNAIMYYINTQDHFTDEQIKILMQSNNYLNGISGVFINNQVLGNAGWSIDKDSIFFKKNTACGGRMLEHQLIVNLNILPNWSHVLFSNNSLSRMPDSYMTHNPKDDNKNDIQDNIYSSNIMRSDLTLNNSIIFTNDDNNSQVILQQEHNHLDLKSDTAVNLVSNAILPSKRVREFTKCGVSEVGTIATNLDAFINNTNISKTYNTLVCSKNNILCSDDAYCYLPSTNNKIIFQNKQSDLQNQNGEFVCPKELPFATNVTLSKSLAFSKDFNIKTSLHNIDYKINNQYLMPINGIINKHKIVVGYSLKNYDHSTLCRDVCLNAKYHNYKFMQYAQYNNACVCTNHAHESYISTTYNKNLPHILMIKNIQIAKIASVTCEDMPIFN